MDASSQHLAPFGSELRRRRTDAGLSLTALAKLVHYSKSHLSKVETGVKPPSQDLARRCDGALSCAGKLAKLAPGPPPAAFLPVNSELGEVWILTLDNDGGNGFRAVSRRQLLAGGVAGLGGLDLSAHGAARLRPGTPPRGGEAALSAYRAMFDLLRGLGQYQSPAMLMPTLVSQTHALRTIALNARPSERDGALVLAARYAEYTGWMAQEAGDDNRAIWWTDHAVDLASAAGDDEMAAYSLVRRGLITLYRHDAGQTVDLAVRAQSATTDPRIRGLAAQREAQGHALAGDRDSCLRALDRAAALLAQPADGAGGPVVGTSHVADPVAVVTGWCLFDLGRPMEAAEILRRELDRIPAHAARARTRFGARLALALADAGEPEAACAAAAPVLDAYGQIDSATIRVDLRGLARELNRWPTHPAILETRLQLTEALRTPAALA